jgi:hypothetical protein
MFWLLPLILILMPTVVLSLRGDGFHNHLVNQAAGIFREVGLDVALEHPLTLPDGRIDFVDVWVTGLGVVLACEVETTPRYVLVNAEKALVLAVQLWVVVPDRRLKVAISRKVVTAFPQDIPGSNPGAGPGAIRFLLVGEIRQALTNHLSGFSPVNTPRKSGNMEKQTLNPPQINPTPGS